MTISTRTASHLQVALADQASAQDVINNINDASSAANPTNTAITTIGAGTLTAAAMTGGLITRSGSVAAYTDTTATAGQLYTARGGNSSALGSFYVTIRNTVAFPETIAGGTGMVVSGASVIAPLSTGTFLVTLTSATAGTVVGVSSSSLSTLPPAKFVTINVTTGTLAAGNASGAAIVNLTSTNATPGSQAMRTPAQVLADSTGLSIGSSYVLRIRNTGAGTFTLATDSGVGFTMTGTMTVTQNSVREFVVTLNSATTGTVQDIGSVADFSPSAGVAGVASGYKIARSAAAVAVTGTLDVDTGLATVLGWSVTAESDLDGDTLAGVSAAAGAAGHITIKCWKVTTGGAAGNPTLIAADAAKNVRWVAIGT